MKSSPHHRITMAEMVDRVIDRDIVLDAECRVHALGILLSKIDAHVVVASLDRYRELCAMDRHGRTSWT